MQKTHASAPSRQRSERCSLEPPVKAGAAEKPNEEDAPRRSESRTGKLVFLRDARSVETRAGKIQRTAQLECSTERAETGRRWGGGNGINRREVANGKSNE
ncbi:hypothetical protein NDU88_010159 [Pleurodeles waltl]|uniref:Uncharacterized protein n=1 Tax=Pleurodeles waltl TaxID=8319 RepID=A0AAV7QWK2_PLEWA|nr:hypothetical protein NDU88_010159 [Pleurodeles waltl]